MTDDLKAAAKKLHLSDSEIEAYLEQQQAAKADAGKPRLTVYAHRKRGRDYCQTDGSKHYRHGDIEQMDYIIARGWADGFCKGSVTKYLARHNLTRNMEDLRKAADLLHILAGVELTKKEGEKV